VPGSARWPPDNHESRLVAPEIAAAIGTGIIAASVAFTVTFVRIEIAPFTTEFATVGVGITAIDFTRTGGTVLCNDYGHDGIGIATGHRRRGNSLIGSCSHGSLILAGHNNCRPHHGNNGDNA